MASPFYTIVALPVLGWFVALSLWLVGYLLVLKIREVRLNRRMDQQRQRLGLRPVCKPLGSWLL